MTESTIESKSCVNLKTCRYLLPSLYFALVFVLGTTLADHEELPLIAMRGMVVITVLICVDACITYARKKLNREAYLYETVLNIIFHTTTFGILVAILIHQDPSAFFRLLGLNLGILLGSLLSSKVHGELRSSMVKILCAAIGVICSLLMIQ